MRKLPVFEAFRHAAQSTWNNLGFAFHASWPWLVLLLPLNLWAEIRMPEINPPDASGTIPPEQATAILVFYAVAFVSMIIYSSIAVSWHRYVLKDEVPHGAARLRLDSTVWRYVGNTILAVLMVTLLILPLAIVFAIISVILGGMSPLIMTAYLAATVLLALPATYRLSIKLPAIAVDRKGFRFGDAWNATRGNMTQLVLLGVLSFSLVFGLSLVMGAIESVAVRLLGETLGYAFMLLRHLGNWVIAIFTITLLTSLYGFFVEGREF